MTMLLLLLACGGDSGESSSSSPATEPQPSTPVASTDSAAPALPSGSTGDTSTRGDTGDNSASDVPTGTTADTGSTGDTGTGTPGPPGDTALPPVVTCDPAPTITALPAVIGSYAPVPFAPRPDGWVWFGLNGGIYEGGSIATSTLVFPHSANALALRDDTLWWLDNEGPPTFWRAEGGQPPVAVATLPDGPGPYLTTDIETHPAGSVMAWYVPPLSFGSPPTTQVAWVSPAGALHTTGVTGLPAPSDVGAVAYRADATGLWAAAQDGLRAYAVDAEGRPDWSTIQQTVPWPNGGVGAVLDLLVDSCDRVYLLGMTGGYIATSVDVGRLDPATGDWVFMGNVDHAYGWSFLRFGGTNGRATEVLTMSGGWTTGDITWEAWDVGATAP